MSSLLWGRLPSIGPPSNDHSTFSNQLYSAFDHYFRSFGTELFFLCFSGILVVVVVVGLAGLVFWIRSSILCYADVVVFFVFYEVSFLGVSYADVSEEVSTTLPFGCSVCFGRGSLKIPMSWLVLVLRQNPKPVGEFPLQGDAAIGPVCPWCATGYDSRYGMFTGSAIERFLPY
ncbi:hypothetical protein MRB53_036697 [Persea americana]|nr:hypothetical protein MRB53_036697 [Persea americana]